jgi:hypothetical protein
VILVGDTFHFKNIVATRVEKSLEELDCEYDKQLRMQKESNKRYQRISSSLIKGGDPDEDEGTSNPFGTSSGRKKSSSGRKEAAGGGGRGGAFKGHMNDAGQDVDEERNFEEFNGVGLEYEEQVSDDDDDAELLQGVDEEREENDVDAGDIFEEDEDDSDSSSEAVDEEEEEPDALDSKDKALQQASSELSDFLSSSKPAATSASPSLSLESGVIVVNRASEVRAEGGGNEKRKEPPADLSPDEEKNKKRKTASSSGLSLTEDLVRQTIIRMGGRVAAKNLAQVLPLTPAPPLHRLTSPQELKKPIKHMGEAGKTKFREIVVKITHSEDDAVFGKVLVLKK